MVLVMLTFSEKLYCGSVLLFTVSLPILIVSAKYQYLFSDKQYTLTQLGNLRQLTRESSPLELLTSYNQHFSIVSSDILFFLLQNLTGSFAMSSNVGQIAIMCITL